MVLSGPQYNMARKLEGTSKGTITLIISYDRAARLPVAHYQSSATPVIAGLHCELPCAGLGRYATGL